MIGESLRHAASVVLGRGVPATQTTCAEQDTLRRHARGCRRAVEIGVFEGFNTRLVAEEMADDGVLYGIDPFFRGRFGVSWGKVIARRHIHRSDAAARVRFVEMLSWEAASALDGSFDFAFVDGDHSWDGIERDWTDWAPRISTGGIVALHDTWWTQEDPPPLDSYRFFEDVIQPDPRFEQIEAVDSLAVLRRL